MKVNRDSSVLIATFSPWQNGKRLPINGNLEPMLDFFVPKVKKTVLIDQVYPGSDFVMPMVEIYARGKKKIKNMPLWMYFLYPILKLSNTGGTHVSFKIRDFLSVIAVGFPGNTTYDVFIGFEAINAIAGYVLKKMGKVQHVIYYVSDYSTKRYKHEWFNRLYLWLDRYAAMHADVIWDVSPAMQPARISVGLDPNKSAPVKIVPNALYPSQIKQASEREIVPYSLVFMGTLGVENGPDIAIKALPLVLQKFKQTTLHIVGGNQSDLARLGKLVTKLRIEKKVFFHGFIADRIKVSEAIRNYQIALAPYKYIKGSPRLYGDATKIRAYMAAGLPTITTHVPPLGREIEKKKAGIVVKDTPEDLAKAAVHIFSDISLYKTLRSNAIAFAKNNTWEIEYQKAIGDIHE